MSHITHFYHLAALDFINTTNFPGMSPWIPSYTASDMLLTSAGALGPSPTPVDQLVLNYVEALSMRRKMHTASALFSGRHPIQNAIAPGGVTTLFSSTMPALPLTGTDYDMFGPYPAEYSRTSFKGLLNEVRTFINTKYLPNVVTVATTFTSFGWANGAGCGKFLSYGDYPLDSSGSLLIKRGIVDIGSLTMQAFDQEKIEEYVDYSWYNYGVLDPAGLHPFDGRTTPNMAPKIGSATEYSWLKAPRYMDGTNPQVCEVGPLARILVSYGNGALTGTNAYPKVSQAGATSWGGVPAEYSITDMVGWALTVVPTGAADLDSVLGRHATRALEAKLLADAMAGTTSPSITSWVDQLEPNASCYTYKKIPKQIRTGFGLCEAPRGALGHWIKIEGRKVAKYQCVVPSTWNFSPAHAATIPGSIANRGAVEAALVGSIIGAAINPEQQIVNILRLVHPFDCCIACAVHVVSPDGKEKLKFAIGPDGRPTNVEIAE